MYETKSSLPRVDSLDPKPNKSSTAAATPRNSDTNDVRQPNFVHVNVNKDDDSRNVADSYIPVIDITSPEFEPIPTEFKLFDESGKKELESTAENITNHFWSLDIVETIVMNSNLYIEKRRKKEKDLAAWKNMNNSRHFTVAETYHFLAIIYYMGIVKLPSKTDYWSTDPLMPIHSIATELGMTRDRFEFLF